MEHNSEFQSRAAAKEIMGHNFFGVDEAIKHFGVNPTKRELAMLESVPYTKEQLEACKDSHILVAIFPISIAEISSLKGDMFCTYNAWYENEKFATNPGELGWYLVKKEPVKNSEDKTLKKQKELLLPNEEVPTTQMMTYLVIGHYLSTNERLFQNQYVRCSDIYPGKARHSEEEQTSIAFMEGEYDDWFFVIGCDSIYTASEELGLSSVIK